jgi:transposase
MAASYTRQTDSQWQISSKFLTLGKNMKYSLRDILDGIFYLVRTGCQWRNLPKEFPPYGVVFYHYTKWSKNGTIEKLNAELVSLDRKRENRESEPSLLCIDCQMVKCGPMINEDKGLNGNKRVNGRGRTLLVDSGGRILAAHVEAANVHDGKSGINLIRGIKEMPQRVSKILFDVAYNGAFADFIIKNYPIIPQVSSKPPSEKGFIPLKQRWVSERQFGCLNFFRRLDKDHEKTTKSSVSMILLVSIQILLQRAISPVIQSFDKRRFAG